jgi:SAM-dependent methyltransferase
MPESTGPNAEQISYWNEVSGPKWVELTDSINQQIEPLGRMAIDRAAPASGERVMDVGCGCGQTSLELGQRVDDSGVVTGLDISEPMLENARERARAAGASNVSFLRADAQTHAFAQAELDLIFSRFGVMFFDDPLAAFGNLFSALAPGGRLVFVCWQTIAKNPWMVVPAAAAAQHVQMPAPPAPDAPGPFAFADETRLCDIIEGAGFTDFGCEPIEERLQVGAGMDMDAIIRFLQQMGPAGAALRESTPEVIEKVTASMGEALAPYYKDGSLEMDSAVWLVTARRA